MKKLKKVLVANRGEVACRIFQACRELDLVTVGIFTAEDRHARHVTYADESHLVESYLDIASILSVASQAQVHCIHPGYGFLSENPIFAQSVEEAHLIWIGPSSQTIFQMGNKTSAKLRVEALGIPTLPWALLQSEEELFNVAERVGYPFLLKTMLGGGGKGIRLVTHAEQLVSLAESACSESRNSFGDAALFLERYQEEAQHIEVQVFGDGRGGGIHLFTRECSLQRRYQKIWEEAPACYPHADQLYADALKILQATRYRGVGTLEFLIDASGRYYFLEMNTRLQVEHTVTEMVTGIDLVRAQLLQALGAEFRYETPSLRGHAIEVRLCAEDPSRGFIPTQGCIQKLKWPTGLGIRIESGIEEGQEWNPHYDSVLGKLIVLAETREHALQRLKFALQETVIFGIGSNQSYLLAVLEDVRVQKGELSTHVLRTISDHFCPKLSALDLELAVQVSKVNSNQTKIPVDEKTQCSPWFAQF